MKVISAQFCCDRKPACIIAYSRADFVCLLFQAARCLCIDRVRQPHYICGMTTNSKETISIEQEIARLEEQIGTLIGLVERLTRENRSLRVQQESLTTERAGLLEKHDQVRSRVDAIVTRLKSLESGA